MATSPRPTAPEVLKWMKDLNDWFRVGEKVDVPFSKLRALEDMYPLEPERAREEMVGVWLERDPHPTWAKLADGFEHAGQRALARRIRETYNCPKKSTQSRSVSHRRQEPPPTNKRPSPPTGAATSYPLPPSSPPPSSPPPYRMSGHLFECYCRGFTPSVSKFRGTGQSASDISSLPASQRAAIEMRLKQESDEMILRFGGFVKRVLHSLKSHSVPVSNLVNFLADFNALPSDKGHAPLLRHRYKQLNGVCTVDEVIFIVADYVSVFNHSLLENLVQKFGSDDDHEELETFLTYFEVFSRRCVFEVPPYMYGYMWVQTEVLVVLKMDVPNDFCTVRDVFDLHRRVCEVMRMCPHALHVCRVSRGSPMELFCRVPPHVMEEVFPLSSDQEVALSSAGLVQLHSPDYCFSKTDSNWPSSESDEVATSDFISPEEEDSSDPVKSNIESSSAAWPTDRSEHQHKLRGKECRAGAKRGEDSQLDELLTSQLAICCLYHEQMSRHRNQSRALVTQGDLGYDGDSETSTEDATALDACTNLPIRHSRKRLRWQLAHSQF